MKTELILVGRTQSRLTEEGMADYARRVAHYMPFNVEVIPELKNTRAMSHDEQKQREGELILKRIGTADHVVLFDEHGRQYRSVDFARWLQKKQAAGQKLVLVVGGPYGFSEAVRKRADEAVSLSPMTFSHQMVRLIIAEQIYRACTIIKGEPYHHE